MHPVINQLETRSFTDRLLLNQTNPQCVLTHRNSVGVYNAPICKCLYLNILIVVQVITVTFNGFAKSPAELLARCLLQKYLHSQRSFGNNHKQFIINAIMINFDN